MSEIQCVAPVGDRTGEGAVWSAREQALYWVDINRFLVHRLNIADGSARSFFFDEPAVALALTSDPDTLLVALGSRLILWNTATDARRDHPFQLADAPEARLNDGRPDPRGDFWVGSMKNNVLPNGEGGEVAKGFGKLFRIRAGDTRVFRDNLGISNTLCWSPDRTKFYFGDTMENEIRVYDYDMESGDISNERPFFSGFDRGYPDGSAMDSDGYLWNCRYGGGCIVRVAPDGAIDRIVDMPVSNITTCTFGGQDLKTLYITTAIQVGERLAGSLFSTDVEVPGQAENQVAL